MTSGPERIARNQAQKKECDGRKDEDRDDRDQQAVEDILSIGAAFVATGGGGRPPPVWALTLDVCVE